MKPYGAIWHQQSTITYLHVLYIRMSIMNLAALVSMFLRMAAWIGLRLTSNARDISGSGHCGCQLADCPPYTLYAVHQFCFGEYIGLTCRTWILFAFVRQTKK